MMRCRAVLWMVVMCGAARAQSVQGIEVPAVADFPFTARMTLEWTHNVNGRMVTGHILATTARDSRGRVHGEGHDFTAGTPDPAASLTEITYTDPAALTRTVCSTVARVCRIFAFTPPAAANVADPYGMEAASQSGLPRTTANVKGGGTVTIESLGVQTTGNFRVIGIRRVTSPAGSDGRPVDGGAAESAIDSWYSRDLRLMLAQDRRFAMGETQALHLVVLSQSEPDEALFALPAGYAMEDERKASVDLPSDVTPPQLLTRVDPQVSDEARQHRPLDATVIVGLVVDTKGDPQRVHVIRGVGMGLDEKAVEAVMGYRFRPAVQDGKAVNVGLSVAVRFQLF